MLCESAGSGPVAARPFVAALVVAGDPRHHVLRVAALDIGAELLRRRAAQRRCKTPVMADLDALAADHELETVRRSSHGFEHALFARIDYRAHR